MLSEIKSRLRTGTEPNMGKIRYFLQNKNRNEKTTVRIPELIVPAFDVKKSRLKRLFIVFVLFSHITLKVAIKKHI